MADHFGLDFNLVELLAGVDADDAADHLGHDDHVAQVRLDEVGLLVGLGLLLGLAQLLDQTHGLALETAVEPAAGASVDDIAELLGGEVQEPVIQASQRSAMQVLAMCMCLVSREILAGSHSLVEVNATVGEFAERSLSLQLCWKSL